MDTTNRILAIRVSELTDALVEAHRAMRGALASGDQSGLEDTCRYIENLIGLEDVDDDSDDSNLMGSV
jgi:hypothetical protein